MKTLSRILFIALFTVALTSCMDEGPVSVADMDGGDAMMNSSSSSLFEKGSGNKDLKMVPFKGSGNWQAVAFAPDFENMEIEITVKLEGTATHLGRFEAVWTTRHTFDLVTGLPGEYLSHTTIYTAANGDELQDEGDPEKGTEHFMYEDGLSFFMTGVHLVEGTGRFENTEGLYDILVLATEGFPFPGGIWELEGEISTVGSTRRGR